MSDLVKNLRNPDWVKNWFDQAGFQAADRIEELQAQRDELLEALKLADAALSGANMNMEAVERKARAAIAKAKEAK